MGKKLLTEEDRPEFVYAVFPGGETDEPTLTTSDEDKAYRYADKIGGRVVTYKKAY